MPLLFDAANERRKRFVRHFELLAAQGISHVELQLAAPAEEGAQLIELTSIDIGEGLQLHVFDDVTSQRKLALATEAARLAAERANQTKSSFLANMSHEIRTPLNGIIGLAEILRLGDLDPTQADYVRNILRSSHSLLEIVGDLLDFAKIESGRIEFEAITFNLRDLANEVVATAMPAAADKNLRLECEMAADVPGHIVGDRLRLAQILRNLLGNAVKFTEQGHVGLTVRLERDEGARTWLCLAVEDTGIGMSGEEMRRIFTPFVQTDVSISRRYGGTGLGLAISRAFAQGMGGSIEVGSVPGEGSRFTLRVPFVPVQVSPDVTDASPDLDTEAIPQGAFAGARVFVAEDKDINQQVIAALLRHAGIDVSLADDGDMVVRLVREAVLKPDVVLMDVQMPVMDGLAATRALRADGYGGPVVALSAGTSKIEKQACEEAGMNDFLGKPIHLDELAAVLTRWLPTRRKSAGASAAAAPDARRIDLAGRFPGIDLEDALPRFLDDHEVLSRIRDAFVQKHRGVGQDLSGAAIQGDWKAIGMLAHQMRGAAANIGAKALAGSAAGLESAARAGDAAVLPGLIAAIEEEFKRLAGATQEP
jgi:signal transduction histidine kinase/FixJ family two-component response regulator/HPt (histidine-containing phosphotransfer) domain-containing protein